MKKVIALFAMVFALCATTFAQSATAPAKDAAKTEKAQGGKRMEGKAKGDNPMKSEFGLSADQETKFRAANKAQKDAMQALQADQTLDKAAKVAKMKAQKDTYEAQVKSIFTPEQYAKWEAKREARKEDAKGKMQDHKGGMKHDAEKAPAPAKQ